MDPAAAKLIGAGLAAMGAGLAAIGVGFIFGSYVQGAFRNPEADGRVSGRLFLGFGNSLAQMASPVLLTEICHPQHRGKVTTIYNCLWNLGALGRYPCYDYTLPY